jgi:lysophospholipase L1-like esterase
LTGTVPLIPSGYGARYDFVLTPYLMFAEPDKSRGGTLNAQGFDGPLLSAEKAANEVRIAVIGGSAAWSGGRDASIARFLELALQSDLGNRGLTVRVVNFGRQSYVSMQELILLQRVVLPLGFDLVVVYDGFNDIWVPWRNEPMGVGYPYLYSSLRERVETATAINLAVEDLVARSAVVAWLRARSIRNRAHDTPLDMEKCLSEYARNLRQMAVLTRAYGGEIVLVTQPFVGHKTTRTAEENRFLDPLGLAQMQSYYARMVDIAAKTAREAGARHLDILDVFSTHTERIFYDPVHVDPQPGNRLIAERIAGEVMNSGVLQSRFAP